MQTQEPNALLCEEEERQKQARRILHKLIFHEQNPRYSFHRLLQFSFLKCRLYRMLYNRGRR